MQQQASTQNHRDLSSSRIGIKSNQRQRACTRVGVSNLRAKIHSFVNVEMKVAGAKRLENAAALRIL